MDRTDREQGWDRNPPRSGSAVGEDEDVHPVLHGSLCLFGHLQEPRLQSRRTVRLVPGYVDRFGSKDVVVHMPDRFQLRVEQDRLVEGELAGVVLPLGEQVQLAPHPGGEAHHDLLPDRVDRRVCYLGEELLEVAEQRRPVV